LPRAAQRKAAGKELGGKLRSVVEAGDGVRASTILALQDRNSQGSERTGGNERSCE
jgi:hypothetical protein